MRPNSDHAHAMALAAQGLNHCEIARATGIPRSTIRYWRRPEAAPSKARNEACPRCGESTHGLVEVPRHSYAYLFGMYLGDGHISRIGRTYRLRVSLDMEWPGIMNECANAMAAVLPDNRVSYCRPDPKSWCAVASVYSGKLPCLFPQHGPGPKHLRRIELADWQQEIVDECTEQFIRGLIHSDGSRFMNRVRVNGKQYAYPRYNFTNASGDIRELFTSSCDRLGIAWRRMNARNISVARREAVARLDEFVGPKN